jgi:hypothetical protein
MPDCTNPVCKALSDGYIRIFNELSQEFQEECKEFESLTSKEIR